MAEFFASLQEFTPWTVALRVFLAALAGALVGIEREFHGRAAGLRTHMMVSLGAALTTMIGIFVIEELHIQSEPMRIGAQVISGVGFLGAGTILLRRGTSHITGLTTAAGLWTAASIGLAVGVGFYEGAFLTVLAVVLVFTLISKVEAAMNSKRQRLFVYLEVDSVDAIRELTQKLDQVFGAVEIQVTPPRSGCAPHVGVETLIRLPKEAVIATEMELLSDIDHVVFAIQNF